MHAPPCWHPHTRRHGPDGSGRWRKSSACNSRKGTTSPDERPSRQSKPRLVRHRRHHAALAVRAGRGHARHVRRPRSSSTKRSSRSTCRRISAGDVVGIGIHTGNALRGYEVGARPAQRGAHGRLRRHPRDAVSRTRRASSAARTPSSTATAIASGRRSLRDCVAGTPAARLRRRPHRRRHVPARRAGICCRADRYMWASVQTVRGCPKHCSFCSVWRTDGQKPRSATSTR